MVKTLLYSAGGAGLILGRELTSLMMKHENIKQKQYCNKFNKDFKKKWSTFKLCLYTVKPMPSAAESSQCTGAASSENQPQALRYLPSIFWETTQS